MSSHRNPNLADLPHRIRDTADNFSSNWKQWRCDVRDDPRMLWRTGFVRIAFWIILGVALYFTTRGLIGDLFTGPAESDNADPPLATLYVACSIPGCAHDFQTRQAMSFTDWPLACPVCDQPSVYRAHVCPQCRAWIATAPGQPADRCPHCTKTQQETAQPSKQPVDPDDREDGW